MLPLTSSENARPQTAMSFKNFLTIVHKCCYLSALDRNFYQYLHISQKIRKAFYLRVISLLRVLFCVQLLYHRRGVRSTVVVAAEIYIVYFYFTKTCEIREYKLKRIRMLPTETWSQTP